ncbi:MAG: hypothetical protein IJ538_04020 [Clostridia bacterium]|nr:hypothetical protein [Clostridia bacterium]
MDTLELLKNYTNSNTIIIDNLDTYPDYILKLLTKKGKIITDYNIEMQKHYEICKERGYSPTSFQLGSSIELDELISEICEYLYLNNYNVLAFHVCRLTNEEYKTIKKTGLKNINYEFLYERISNLVVQNIIDESEGNELILAINNKEKRLNNMLGVFCGSQYFNTPEYCVFFENWGGMIISNHYNNDNLKEKLRSMSKPFMLLYSVETSKINNLKTIVKNILINGNDLIKKSISTEFYMNIESKFLDILNIEDRNDKIIILGKNDSKK